jgi:hypothetical protein
MCLFLPGGRRQSGGPVLARRYGHAMPDIVERLEKRIRRHITQTMPAAPGYIEEQCLSGLLIDYRVWRGRFLQPRPRNVHRSSELKGSTKSKEHSKALAAIEAKIAKGEDLNPHLSSRISMPVGGDAGSPLAKRSDRDLLLAEWDVHHLHLSTEMGPKGFTKRTGDALFAVFRDSDAYLLGVFAHPANANWAAKDIFAVLVRNWPGADLVIEARGLIGLSQDYSDEDRLKLRASGVMNLQEVDGKIYSPASIGLTTAGTPTAATRQADALMRELNRWRADPYTLLRETTDAPHSIYWLPAIHPAVPGFEEYCGFTAEGTFVPVGRLC